MPAFLFESNATPARFIANTGRFVVPGFRHGGQSRNFSPVRSYQLCCGGAVVGSPALFGETKLNGPDRSALASREFVAARSPLINCR